MSLLTCTDMQKTNKNRDQIQKLANCFDPATVRKNISSRFDRMRISEVFRDSRLPLLFKVLYGST